ncbi:hypothetical protein GCM10009038_19500 [Salinicola rhizosphaerae]|uniref:Uncharacterized protein n=1 Tax=Salinicola rhizosphaerae TaxID=1443141 RepID=A0ABQ3DYS9_9GAMM|nr:hypothetical protein GCM10009038_19500 [Salinicola rhizosphaerae]
MSSPGVRAPSEARECMCKSTPRTSASLSGKACKTGPDIAEADGNSEEQATIGMTPNGVFVRIERLW